MSTELTLEHYKGKWKYQGQNLFGFDEMDLFIDRTGVEYVQRLNGEVVRKESYHRNNHFNGELLIFELSGIDPFYVSKANEKTMLCGHLKNRGHDGIKWQIEVIREQRA